MGRELKSIVATTIYIEDDTMNMKKIYKSVNSDEVNESLKNEVLEYLKQFNDEDKIGLLITKEDMYETDFIPNSYAPLNEHALTNVVSRICDDKTNWITVKETKDIVKGLSYKKPRTCYSN